MIYGNYFLENHNKRILYHASNIQGLKTIEPRREHINPKMGEACVYTSPNKVYASVFGARWHDDIGHLSTYDYKYIYFGVTDKIDMESPCSLYEIVDDGSGIEVNRWEIAFTHPMKVYKEHKYKTFKECLKDNGVNVTSRDEMLNFKYKGKKPEFSNWFNEAISNNPLPQYRLENISEDMRQKYRSKYKEIIHVNTGLDSYIWFDGDNVVAFVYCKEREGVWHLSNIFVDPKYRSQGIGDAIVKFCIDKYNIKTLGVLKTNTTAINLYKKNGFKINKQFNIDRPDSKCYLMVRL